MSDEKIANLASDARRAAERRRVIDWARRQMNVPELSGALLEGPGGDGPDLIFFAQGAGMAIYLADDCAGALPNDSNDWCLRWDRVGAPAMSVYVADGEIGARRLMLKHLNIEGLGDVYSARKH